MKKLNFDIVFKVISLISLVYSLFLLTVIAKNSGTGRYQTAGNGIIDTKTGVMYDFRNGKLIEWTVK